MNDKRRENETYEQYRERLRLGKYLVKIKLSGRWIKKNKNKVLERKDNKREKEK